MKHTQEIETAAKTEASRDERVSHLAYQIWEVEGQPEGQAEDHWLRACAVVDAEMAFTEGQTLPTWLNRSESVSDETAKQSTVEPLLNKASRRSAA